MLYLYLVKINEERERERDNLLSMPRSGQPPIVAARVLMEWVDFNLLLSKVSEVTTNH